jgi:hypothetical protein
MEKQTIKNKEDFQEFLAALWCVLNCATTLEKRIALMQLVEKYATGRAMEKLRAYADAKKSVQTGTFEEIERFMRRNA